VQILCAQRGKDADSKGSAERGGLEGEQSKHSEVVGRGRTWRRVVNSTRKVTDPFGSRRGSGPRFSSLWGGGRARTGNANI